jgi:hypothetical protein
MTTSVEWRRRIVQLVQVKQRLVDVDTQKLCEYRLQALRPTRSSWPRSKSGSPSRSDPSYRGYLNCGGGWCGRCPEGRTAADWVKEQIFLYDKEPTATDPTKEPYNAYRFNSARWDHNSGNYDMGFRDYNPGLTWPGQREPQHWSNCLRTAT